jgi:hypothetical protein
MGHLVYTKNRFQIPAWTLKLIFEIMGMFLIKPYAILGAALLCIGGAMSAQEFIPDTVSNSAGTSAESPAAANSKTASAPVEDLPGNSANEDEAKDTGGPAGENETVNGPDNNGESGGADIETISGDAIRYFEKKLTTNVFVRNNFFNFSPPDVSLWSMKPAETGFTVIWKKLALGLSFGIPFTTVNDNALKSSSFDFKFDHYGNRIYWGGSAAYYSVFRRSGLNDNSYFDMIVFSGGIFGEYLINNKNHSLHAVYNMDAEQTVSSGSWLLGAGLQTTLVQSDSKEYPFGRSLLLHYGPNAGYSYTWIFGDRVFLNAMMVASFNLAVDCLSREWYFALQTRPKIAIGRHFDTWSINGVIDIHSTNFMGTRLLNFNAITLTVTLSKRWQVLPGL